MFWIFVTGLWAAMLVSPFVLLYLFLPHGRECPRCSGETVPVQRRMIKAIRNYATMRWCMNCGWEGLARNGEMRNPIPRLEVVPDNGGDADEPWKYPVA